MSTFDPSILVTGDVVSEVNIYSGERLAAANVATEGTRIRRVPGGASLLHQLLVRLAAARADAGLRVDFGFRETDLTTWPDHLSAYAVFEQQAGGLAKSPDPKKAWRVTKYLGYGPLPPEAPPPPLSPVTVAVPPRVMVLDDGGAGFRNKAACQRWPFPVVPDPARPPAQWIVLKMAKPVAQGDLWRAVSGQFGRDGGTAGLHDRLVTVVNADVLRLQEAGISRGLSWEKSVREICRELATNALVRPLLRSRHLLILFRHEGALWLDTRQPPGERGCLIFDPSHCEGDWESTLADPSGDVFGHLTVFTAFVAMELALRPELNPVSFVEACKRGIEAARKLRLIGHESTESGGGNPEPGFPFARLAAMSTGPLASSLVNAAVPGHAPDWVPDDQWSIVGHHERRAGQGHPLFATAMQVALNGLGALKQVPHARFGKLTSIDPDEMEALRSLRRTIRCYVRSKHERKPLAVAVFGPPGAGKSFGVKQIAQELFGGRPCFLEFNLSQFSSPTDLVQAFHQVRDRVLEGALPLVFWDEFDANQYGWLQYFLTPLQDGKFQDGQVTHTLSRCIFVFAGGTSRDFQHFGPVPEARTSAHRQSLQKRWQDPELRALDEQRRRDFDLRKGPDFISRLDAHFNVAGPNQRRLFEFESGTWNRPDPLDVAYPIRRALLLRSLLGVGDDERLSVEPAVLSVLLRVGSYRHGARSMEKLVLPLRSTPGEPLRRAYFPPRSVLSQHLEDADEPACIFRELDHFRADENLLRLAAAVHENYLRTVGLRPPDPHYLQAFQDLDAWGKATNVAAAARLPEVLALAGLQLVPGTASAQEEAEVREQLERHLAVLAEREHDLWADFHAQNGWVRSATGDKSRQHHRLLLKFEQLDELEKVKDYAAIRSYPELARLAGCKIVFTGMSAPERRQ